jgi:serine/threonine-protein kinase RsbW
VEQWQERMAENSDWTWTTEAKLPSVCGAGRHFLTELIAALQREQWSQQEIFAVHLAVEEALVNAIRHGNRSDSSKQVHVNCQLNHQRLLLEVADEGAGFDPSAVPDCTDKQNLQRPNGRGIMLMRTYMSRVEYTEGGHRLLLEKQRDKSG